MLLKRVTAMAVNARGRRSVRGCAVNTTPAIGAAHGSDQRAEI